MMLELSALSLQDCEQVRVWRNASDVIDMLRTPYRLTEAMQEAFYRDHLSNRRSPHRYFGVRPVPGHAVKQLVACIGLTDISPENRIAEISLIVHPEFRHMGVGRQSVDLVMAEARDRMNLRTVFGEAYRCNPAVSFWERLTREVGGYETTLPNRKFAQGRYWDSYYFSWDVPSWKGLSAPRSSAPPPPPPPPPPERDPGRRIRTV